jgi:hypothetical protein
MRGAARVLAALQGVLAWRVGRLRASQGAS